jgi:AcrR family transcriptional regulator
LAELADTAAVGMPNDADGVKRRRAHTRAQILDAAEKLFLEKGFRAASVHEIAAAAGYTTGAIYSSFDGKDALFLAVFRRRLDSQERIWRDTLLSVTEVAAAPPAMGAALMRAIQEPAWYAVLFEFLSYATREQELARETAEMYGEAPKLVADVLAKAAESSSLPLERLAPIIVALMRGLALAWFVDPDSRDPSLFSDGVAVLIGALPSDGARSAASRGGDGRRAEVP